MPDITASRARRRALPGALPPGLDRRFEAIVFDWDGTAVANRAADATRLRALVEELSAQGLHLAVVTGTHVDNVDGQLGARPSGPGRVFLSVNRGSEVFEAEEIGLRLLSRREPTPEENVALDAAASATVAELGRRGIDATVVSQRLNRRKIDLIPLPEWADPPKARITELLASGRDHAARPRSGRARRRSRGRNRGGPPGRARGCARDERREARRDRPHGQGGRVAMALLRALAKRSGARARSRRR